MICCVSRNGASYPKRLGELPDAPEKLYIRGALSALTPAIAIVGSRAASGHGMALARELACSLAKQGALVISGGAVGIDSAAHLGAMDAGLPTLAVMATGLDDAYPPRNRPLFDEIVIRGGALVSPFPVGSIVHRWHFPKRNRVMAGLADAVVVVEASGGSGSLYTADAALDYKRTLCACPGSLGTEKLLAEGAALVYTAQDILSALAGHPRTRAFTVAEPEPGSDEARAFAALDGLVPKTPNTLGELVGLDTPRTIRALSQLEMEGLALLVPGGRYVRAAKPALAKETA